MSTENDKSLDFSPISSLAENRLFSAPVDDLTDEEAAGAAAVLKFMDDLVKSRHSQIRDRLLERVEDIGEEYKDGSYVADVNGIEVRKTKNQGKLPDEKVVKNLLNENGLSLTEAFDEVKKWEMNPSKVDHLVDGGKIPKKEVEKSKKVTYSLKVNPSGSLKGFIDATKRMLKKESEKK